MELLKVEIDKLKKEGKEELMKENEQLRKDNEISQNGSFLWSNLTNR